MGDNPNGDDHLNIWTYYQNEMAESFAGAVPRLDYLLKRVQRLSGGGVPRLLNIGAGSGYLEETAAARGWRVCSLDPDPETVERLRGKGVDARCGMIERMPFESAAFDFVVASEVLEHLADAQRLAGIREVARVLVDGGWFLGTVPFKENLSQSIVKCPKCGEVFHRWGHQVSFDPQRLEGDLRHGFPLVRTRVTAYLSFRDRSFHGLLSTLARYLLALIRMPITSTSLYFAARTAIRPDNGQ